MNNEYAELDFDNLDMVALTGYSEQKKKCLKINVYADVLHTLRMFMVSNKEEK